MWVIVFLSNIAFQFHFAQQNVTPPPYWVTQFRTRSPTSMPLFNTRCFFGMRSLTLNLTCPCEIFVTKIILQRFLFDFVIAHMLSFHLTARSIFAIFTLIWFLFELYTLLCCPAKITFL